MASFFDLKDFVSLLCLTNTPYPNDIAVSVTGQQGNDDNLKDAVLKLFDQPNRKYLVTHMRLFVAMYVGDADADLGYFIREQMWDWCRKNIKRPPDRGVGSGEVEALRQEIYGKCKKGGHDYFGYQPCPPQHYEPIKTLQEFEKEFDEVSKDWSKDREQKWVDARIELSDMWDRMKGNKKPWAYIVEALSTELGVTPRLLAAGLKREF